MDYLETQDFVRSQDWMEELLHHVYNTGNVEEMERALDELTFYFNLRLPKSEPKLQKKENQLFDFARELSKTAAEIS